MDKLVTFILSGILLFLLVMVVLFVPGSFREYQQARTLESEISEQVHSLYQENQQKELFLRHIYDDPDFLQQQARERLGYVRPGEIVYRFERAE